MDKESLLTVFPLINGAVMHGAEVKRHGLTRTQLIVLMALMRYGRLGMTQTANIICSSREQATRAVAQMAENGHVRRLVDPENRTHVFIELTDAGRALVEKCMADYSENMAARIEESLDADEAEEMKNAILTLDRLLGKLK